MTLIKSISGIRGTIGGPEGDNLTPPDIVKFTSAYAAWLKEASKSKRAKVVIGRDARISGEMVESIIQGTLLGCGVDVINVGLCSTPGVELAVTHYAADGGIIITASHNPRQWNAMKMLNAKGEFLSDTDGKKILAMAAGAQMQYPGVDNIGKILARESFDEQHIKDVLALSLVDVNMIRNRGFSIVVDAVNSVGGIIIPKLLHELGVKVTCLNCVANGEFAHNPEPLPENLTEISAKVPAIGADLGIVVDPDVDRLALVCEDGSMFGEEYTLVAVADYVLSRTPGNTVSNLSSTRALSDVTAKYGGSYAAAAVGEVNVVTKMKETNAVIGGEGNGGVIYPASHYGRDALVGIALLLTHLAKTGKTASQLRAGYPEYYISKNKIELTPGIDVDAILKAIKEKYSNERVNDIDGVKIDFADGWVHLRKSNTEPIIRIYSEMHDRKSADALAQKIITDIKAMI